MTPKTYGTIAVYLLITLLMTPMAVLAALMVSTFLRGPSL